MPSGTLWRDTDSTNIRVECETAPVCPIRAENRSHSARSPAPDRKPKTAGSHGAFPASAACSMAGRSKLNTAAAAMMPAALKEKVAARVNKAAQELYGIENFADMICDETVASSADDLDKMLEFLAEKGHPALAMEPML